MVKSDVNMERERDCHFHVILRSDDFRLHRHTKLTDARKELARLARQCPDSKFYILTVTHAAGPIEPPVQIREIDEIPF